jgi:hypothetical protein
MEGVKKMNVKKILLYICFAIACMFISSIHADALSTFTYIPTDNSWTQTYNFWIGSRSNVLSQTRYDEIINHAISVANSNLNSTDKKYYIISSYPAGADNYENGYVGLQVDINMFGDDSLYNLNFKAEPFSYGSSQYTMYIATMGNVPHYNYSIYYSNYGSSWSSPSYETSSFSYSNTPFSLLNFSHPAWTTATQFIVPKNAIITNYNNLGQKSLIVSVGTGTTNYAYRDLTLNGVTYTNGQGTYLQQILSANDTEPPILDFSNISHPQWIWKNDDFVAPMPIATDNIDGNITDKIQITSTINPSVAGNYVVTYEVCDAHNNCTSANLSVEVRETIASINMTGKYAILFYYKDFSQVTNLNAICDSIDLSGNCFVQTFNYTGRWKYSKVLLSNLDALLYENGGIYAPLDSASTDYKNYNNINIGHLTDNFNVGSEYGVLMYNESGANTVYLKYNKKYFDYKIYISANDTEQKNIDYINIGGTPTNTTDTTPPYTKLEDPAQQGNEDAGGIFGSFTTDTYGLTAIISAPLNLINQLTSKTCQPLIIPLPYLNNKSITLPCMTEIYQTYFGEFLTLYQLITFGFVAYYVVVRILNMIKDFKNPDHDEIEVLDL